MINLKLWQFNLWRETEPSGDSLCLDMRYKRHLMDNSRL